MLLIAGPTWSISTLTRLRPTASCGAGWKGPGPLSAYDMMIAAHAINRRVCVVTNNRREFDRVEGLAVEDWSV